MSRLLMFFFPADGELCRDSAWSCQGPTNCSVGNPVHSDKFITVAKLTILINNGWHSVHKRYILMQAGIWIREVGR
ncbi:hypothetical protein XELAEV_18001729mg [Xenopus laevis]|nr:hypothetical protein XELAEV_18001729mg [Xenopus laevis]